MRGSTVCFKLDRGLEKGPILRASSEIGVRSMIRTGETMRSKLLLLAAALIACPNGSPSAVGQTQTTQTVPAAAPQPLPFPTQLKKTVVFIRTNCVHMPTGDELSAMSPRDRARWTDEEIAKLKPEEFAQLRQDSYFGTGFIAAVPDVRLGKDISFLYLVTNRHVARPGVENGRPCKVVNYSFSLNHVGQGQASMPYLQSLVANPGGFWTFPDDESVDLAATAFTVAFNDFDFKSVSIDQFVSQEMINKGEVVEGDPVIFTGLFIQYSGVTRLEPVVRSGTIAMLPSDLVQTTLRKLGHVYFAEAHAFGGNSGSPMFVDISKFKGGLGFDYRFLGVVTGEIKESADLTLEVSTTYAGTVAANSNVSVIVPAFEVKSLLLSAAFQRQRDAYVASLPTTQPAAPQPTK